jgi:hypothetical protein
MGMSDRDVDRLAKAIESKQNQRRIERKIVKGAYKAGSEAGGAIVEYWHNGQD